jgi:hypothetical protein
MGRPRVELADEDIRIGDNASGGVFHHAGDASSNSSPGSGSAKENKPAQQNGKSTIDIRRDHFKFLAL